MDCPRCGSPIPQEEEVLCPYCFFLLPPKGGEAPVQTSSEVAPASEEAVVQNAAEPSSFPEPQKEPTVIDVFGIKINVKNRGLAQLLSMEAKDVLTGEWEVSRRNLEHTDSEHIAEQIPSITDIEWGKQYIELSKLMAKRLGFRIKNDIWRATTGRNILAKVVLGTMDLDEASVKVDELAKELASQQETLKESVTGLFIVQDVPYLGVFLAAIQRKQLFQRISVMAFEDLRQLVWLYEHRHVDHQGTVSLLLPLANMDTNQFLKLLSKAAQSPSP